MDEPIESCDIGEEEESIVNVCLTTGTIFHLFGM